MNTYRASGSVVGGKYIGEVEAESAEEALGLARDLDGCYVSLCHQCTDHCEDPTIEDIDVYNVNDESDRASTRAAPEDRKRSAAALAMLNLVEAVMREKLGPIIIGEYAPGEWEITLHDDIGEDCPRFFGEDLAQAVSATAAALEEQRELERTDCRILGGDP